jgi:hypothetical protein
MAQTTLVKSSVNNFCGILNMVQSFESQAIPSAGMPVIYFRCVEWNHEAEITLWFRIIDKTKMQAYREIDGEMVKLDGISPSFHMTIADMFNEFEYIIKLQPSPIS